LKVPYRIKFKEIDWSDFRYLRLDLLSFALWSLSSFFLIINTSICSFLFYKPKFNVHKDFWNKSNNVSLISFENDIAVILYLFPKVHFLFFYLNFFCIFLVIFRLSFSFSKLLFNPKFNPWNFFYFKYEISFFTLWIVQFFVFLLLQSYNVLLHLKVAFSWEYLGGLFFAWLILG